MAKEQTLARVRSPKARLTLLAAESQGNRLIEKTMSVGPQELGPLKTECGRGERGREKWEE